MPAEALNFDNIDFEASPLMKGISPSIDFENYSPIEWPEPEKKIPSTAKEYQRILDAGEDVFSETYKPPQKTPEEELISGTIQAVPKVIGAIGGSLALLPGAGIRAAIELLPKISTDPDKYIEPGSISKAADIFKEIMSVPGKVVTTEEEAKAIGNIGLAMRPIEMSGEGWRLIGEAANKGLKELGFEDTYIEPLLATYGEAAAVFALPEVVKIIKNSTTFRKITIPERRLIVQSLADTIKKNPNMTEGEILRTFDNPEWKTEALKARALKPEETIITEKPIDFEIAPEEVVIPKEIPVPKTALGKAIAKAIAEEKVSSPLAILKQREAEITADEIDFEQPIALVEPAPQIEAPPLQIERLREAIDRGDEQIDILRRITPDLAPKAPAKASEDAMAQTLYSGIPILEGLKLKAELEALYDKHVGTPLWIALSERIPKFIGDKSVIVDAINKGLITDYKKDPDFIELRDDTLFKIEQAREKAKELATAMSKFPPAEQIRISQVIQGSITATPGRYKAALEVAEEFKKIETELQRLGILGPDNRFKQLTKKAINQKFQEIAELDRRIGVLKKRLEPIIKTSRTIRRVAEDITEEIISSSTDETTGTFQTTVNKFTEANEARVKEALLARGFPEGESNTMIDRIKDSVVPLTGATGTLREIRTKVEKVLTKTIIQETEKLKTYSPSMMARAKNSILKDIKGLSKDRQKILDRIRLHYKMSGKQYLRRAYEKMENDKGFLQGLYAIAKNPRYKLGYNIQRKDLSKNYRDYLGEIKRAPYLVYKGLSEETHDMYLADMFDRISKNKDWAISPKEYDNIMSLSGREAQQAKYTGFKPLPVSKKLGPLSGAMVDPYIWDDLNQAIAVRGNMIKAWDSVLSLWKTGKVVYNPATQVRNFLSNSILADFAGVPHHRIDVYARAARDFLTKSGYYEEAKNTPLLGKEWMGAEIKAFLNEAIDLKRIGNESVLVKMADVFKKIADQPGKLYQANEQYFKLLVYSHARESMGMSIQDAAKHADKWIFNYQKIPPAIRWAKRWYSPFITFSYKAMPRMAETVVRKPWKFAKYLILLAAVEEITRRMRGESKEEVEREKKVLPDYMRKTILPGQLSHVRIPHTDKYNRSKYLDLSFILPWGDVAEQWGQSHFVGRPFLPSHPLYTIVAEVAFNEILFTGQKLTEKDLDEGSEYLKRIGAEIWRQAAPSLAGSYSYNKFMSALYGEKDWAQRERSVGEAVFDVFFGLKIRSIDYNLQYAKRMQELKGKINVIRSRFADDYEMLFLRQPNMSESQKERKYMKLIERKDKDIQKIMDVITDINKKE